MNLPSFANFRVKVPMRLPRRRGQKKVPKGSSRYEFGAECVMLGLCSLHLTDSAVGLHGASLRHLFLPISCEVVDTGRII